MNCFCSLDLRADSTADGRQAARLEAARQGERHLAVGRHDNLPVELGILEDIDIQDIARPQPVAYPPGPARHRQTRPTSNTKITRIFLLPTCLPSACGTCFLGSGP